MANLLPMQYRAAGRSICLWPMVVVCLLVLSLASFATQAQDECPCFSHEEIKSMVLRMQQITFEEGEFNCKAEDYSVELSAEATIWDTNFSVVSQARVEWYDFDPGLCVFIDNSADPAIERNETWPHPAPEAVARLCYTIFSSVIAESDTSGKCMTM